MYQKKVERSVVDTMYHIACMSAALGISAFIGEIIAIILDVKQEYYVRIIIGLIFATGTIIAGIIFIRLYFYEDEIYKKWFSQVVRRKDIYAMTARLEKRIVKIDNTLEEVTGEVTIKHVVLVEISNNRMRDTITFYGRDAYEASLKIPEGGLFKIRVEEWMDDKDELLARSFDLRNIAPISPRK